MTGIALRAKVTGWTDSKDAERFEDEHGWEWVYVTDAADATVAVESVCGTRAGVFHWSSESADEGMIYVAKEGDEYGANNPGEYLCDGHRWVDQG